MVQKASRASETPSRPEPLPAAKSPQIEFLEGMLQPEMKNEKLSVSCEHPLI